MQWVTSDGLFRRLAEEGETREGSREEEE